MNFLTEPTWLWFAYSAAGLTIMAATGAIHITTTTPKLYKPWLLVAGATLGAFGNLVAATQAGPDPFLPRDVEITIVRLSWGTGITLGIMASIFYIVSRRPKPPGDEQ